MRRKDFVLAAAAAAVLAAFNPALAGDSSYDASRSAAGLETTDQSASAGMSADQSSDKAGSSTAMEEGAPSDELERYGQARGENEDKLTTGLERADQQGLN